MRRSICAILLLLLLAAPCGAQIIGGGMVGQGFKQRSGSSPTRTPTVIYTDAFANFGTVGYDKWRNAGLSAETTHLWEGAGTAMRFTIPGGTTSYSALYLPSSPLNWAGKNLALRFYIPEEYWSQLNVNASIQLQMYTTTASNRWTMGWGTALADSQPGWNELVLTWANGAVVGSFDPAQINGMYLIVNTTSSAYTPYVVFETLQVYNPPTKPLAVITFDDGYSDWVTMANILTTNGINGTFYAPMYIGGTKIIDGTGVTTAQLLAMQAQGHLIGNHSWNHPFGFNYAAEGGPEFTQADAVAEIRRMAAWMIANGFSDGAWHFASPHGGKPPEFYTGYFGTWFETYRGAIQVNYADYSTLWRRPALYISQYDNQRGGGVAGWCASVDAAIAANSVFCCVFHHLGSSPYFSEADFTSCIEYLGTKVAAEQITAIRVDELSDNW